MNNAYVCSGCKAPATHELLMVPTKERFPKPIYACIHGARIHGLAFTRKLSAPRGERPMAVSVAETRP